MQKQRKREICGKFLIFLSFYFKVPHFYDENAENLVKRGKAEKKTKSMEILKKHKCTVIFSFLDRSLTVLGLKKLNSVNR